MKKINSLLISLFLLIMILNIEYKEKIFQLNGIKYAVSIDGESASEFPEKAPYDVSVRCSGAKGYWDYDKWVAKVNNITDDVSCSIAFTSKEKINLNTYIKDTLTGTTQGNGQVVNEIAVIDNSTFSPTAVLGQSDYANVANDATYPFTWNETTKTWTSTNKVDSTTSTITFNVSTNNNYQLCYNQSSERNYDFGNFYVDDVSIENAQGKSGDNCLYIGNLTTSNLIKVTYKKDGSSSSGNDNISFYLQTGIHIEDIQNINVGYRFEGKNPANYIKFNNELWRIIGVFDESTHGQTGQYLTKIIRNDSIGAFAWDKSDVNIWPNSSLYKLLNDYYYTAQDGTDSGYCYKYSTITTGNCDWTAKGINDYYRPMVKNVTWYLGGYSSNSATASDFYGYERSIDDSNYYTDNTSYKTTNGYIGLMYVSDYGYSVLSSSCARTTTMDSYTTNACVGNSWLYKDGSTWTITHNIDDSSVVFGADMLGDGKVGDGMAEMGSASHPVLYLDSSVYILNGDGTELNPYVIDM